MEWTTGGCGSMDLDCLIERIQRFAFQKRLRLRDALRDFDPLRTRRVTCQQFRRILDHHGIRLTEKEFGLLVDTYADQEDRETANRGGGGGSMRIYYDEFVERIEQVFRLSQMERHPEVNPPEPGATLRQSFTPKLGSKEVMQVIEKVRVHVRSRGIVLKTLYEDADPLRSGYVKASRFKRMFPASVCSEKELDLLATAFARGAPLMPTGLEDPSNDPASPPGAGERAVDNGVSEMYSEAVNYRYIHNLVTDPQAELSNPAPPLSELHVRADHRIWQQQSTPADQKLQAVTDMNRIRIRSFFLDYDNLRKGYVTTSRARAIIDGLLGLQLPQADWDFLVDKYSREDGMFCYSALCDAIDGQSTAHDLRLTPAKEVRMPRAEDYRIARRNRVCMSQEETDMLDLLEKDMRSTIKRTRKLLHPAFQDFDTTRRGHVTRSQFSRVLSMLGFEVSETQIDLLSLRYANLGNHTELDYREFCDSVDPPPRDVLAGEARSPTKNESTYYDRKGFVVPKGKPIGAR